MHFSVYVDAVSGTLTDAITPCARIIRSNESLVSPRHSKILKTNWTVAPKKFMYVPHATQSVIAVELDTHTLHLQQVADNGPTEARARREREQLAQLIQLQESELNALKAEIHVLRRKSGHIYTPQA